LNIILDNSSTISSPIKKKIVFQNGKCTLKCLARLGARIFELGRWLKVFEKYSLGKVCRPNYLGDL